MAAGADPQHGEHSGDLLGSARVVVFVPTYNERENLGELVSQLLALSPTLRVLIVDDESPDGTGVLADELAARTGRVEVLHRLPPRGRGLAGRDGLRWASQQDCDYVVEMDADLSHRPQDIPALVEACRDADVAIGSRYCTGGAVVGFGTYRKLNSRVAGFLSRWVLGLTEADCTSGFRCFRRSVLLALDYDAMKSDGPSIVGEVLLEVHQRGFTVTEVPITFVERRRGQSKITPGLVFRWIRNLMRVRFKPRAATAKSNS